MTAVARALAAALTAGWLAAPAAIAAPSPIETLTVPVFGTVTVYRPAAAPQQVVLFISGDGGWNLGVVDMAEQLRDAGALVVGIDVRRLIASLNASAKCGYPAGALEELSRAIQIRYKLPSYKRPILAGYSSGATLVYGALAAAPAETFAGGLSLGFCPDLEIQKPLCQMRGLKSTRRKRGPGYDLAPFAGSKVPWMILQGEADQVCDATGTRTFVAATGAARLLSLPKVGHGFGVPARWTPQLLDAYKTITEAHPASEKAWVTTPAVADLPLVEVPAVVERQDSRTLAIVLSGDGGWAEIDKSVAAGLAERGIPVVGWSSLEYYWTPRTPESAAADLARIIEHYTTAWHRERVVVVGYSFGADVAPFLVNRLPAAARARVGKVALLTPSDDASFEFHLAEWLGGGANPANPTAPEIIRLPMPVTCIVAEDEADSVCREITAPSLRVVAIGQGHHFSGDYDRIVEAIVR